MCYDGLSVARLIPEKQGFPPACHTELQGNRQVETRDAEGAMVNRRVLLAQ